MSMKVNVVIIQCEVFTNVNVKDYGLVGIHIL
jgi:hypothetical protein